MRCGRYPSGCCVTLVHRTKTTLTLWCSRHASPSNPYTRSWAEESATSAIGSPRSGIGDSVRHYRHSGL
jgi:hypothetical protein